MSAPEQITRLNAALEGCYEIARELGEGGMATVYLARDLKHNRLVALKVLKPDLAAMVGASRFLAEIETTANLHHPNILPLFDSGEAEGLLYYVMPFIDGEALRDRLESEVQLPVDEAVRIGSEVAEALDYAHRKGVIHRDIKPANLLLHEGRPLVSDFGIALAADAVWRLASDRNRLEPRDTAVHEPRAGDRRLLGRRESGYLRARMRGPRNAGRGAATYRAHTPSDPRQDHPRRGSPRVDSATGSAGERGRCGIQSPGKAAGGSLSDRRCVPGRPGR